MLTNIEKYIDKHRLLCKEQRYLVALSGGADSVALLRILLQLGYSVEAAHCNFRLRGEESDRDEMFCRALCEQLGVEIHVAHFDTRSYSDLYGVSIEMAARELRYNYFRQLLADLKLDAICVAHHRDDSVETVLLNMLRGTGVEGLKGIAPVNADVIRPLLCLSRSEIEGYLYSVKQEYIVDSSNLIADVKRNKIRLNVLPELEKVDASAREHISLMAEHISGVLPILNQAIEQLKAKVLVPQDEYAAKLSVRALLDTPSPQTVLWYILHDYGFGSAQCEQIFENISANPGRIWNAGLYRALLDRDMIVVEKADVTECKEMKIPETGIFIYNDKNRFSFSESVVDDSFKINISPNVATLDASKVTFPLTLRTVREGDWFIPFGMKGKKLISDFLTDRKLSLFEKQRQLVLCDSSCRIVWVVGIRPDARFCVSDATMKVITVEKTNKT